MPSAVAAWFPVGLAPESLDTPAMIDIDGEPFSMRWLIILWLVCCLLPALSQTSNAQLFGARQLGNTLSRRPKPGELTGSERFLRENRNRREFVGRDQRELRRFIGARQASVNGAVAPAAADLRPLQKSDANRSNTSSRRRTTVYPPKLQLGFPVRVLPAERLESALRSRLEQARLGLQGTIEVLVEGRTATLEGMVASPHDRALAEQLCLLEPGIDRVDNRLKVQPTTAEPKS